MFYSWRIHEDTSVRVSDRDRFPRPWSVEEQSTCYVVRDGNGQKLAYIYYEDDAGRRAAVNMLCKDEARRIAANFANLPE